MSSRRVLSVGQCGADHAALCRTFREHFDAEVVPADSAAEALARLREEQFDLVLVNRVLDYAGDSGLDLVRQVRAEEAFREVPVMLVSNLADAQRRALEAGAVPGFGKAALGEPFMLERVRAVLG